MAYDIEIRDTIQEHKNRYHIEKAKIAYGSKRGGQNKGHYPVFLDSLFSLIRSLSFPDRGAAGQAFCPPLLQKNIGERIQYPGKVP